MAAANSACRRPVLIVEDDESIRDSIRDLLEEEGYPVLTAENGAVALSVLSRGQRPCLVVLDLMMPVMDGWQVLDALGADDRLASIPVIVVSAVATGSARSSNVRRYVEKPMSLHTLLAAVQEHCGQPGDRPSR